MKRSLNSINAVSTSHDVGLKRVLLAANDSGCTLTQIAVTDLKADEVAQAHIHPDMHEGFYVLEGDLDVKLDDELLHCTKDDFVYVKSLTSHELGGDGCTHHDDWLCHRVATVEAISTVV